MHSKLISVIIHRIMQHTIIIPETHVNERLDQALAKLMPEYSRTQIQEWISTGNVLINGQAAKAKYKVRGNETISVTIVAKPPLTDDAEPIPLNIVHEDDDVIIINKPVGLVVHPGAGNQVHTLLNALLFHHPELKNLPRAGILHRLDKDTSGLMVVAKTARALKSLAQQLKKRTLAREYQAIVYGKLISGSTINAPIDRHPRKRKHMAVVETGREAVTHYRVAEKYRNHTLLKLRLETGRTHQIRVHLSYIRHPIVGDAIYGGRVQLSKNMTPELIQLLRQFKRQALHAFALGFIHPDTQEEVRYEIDLPEDMQGLIQALREDNK